MVSVQVIFDAFPHLSEQQKEQFSLLYEMYEKINARVNLISRKDIENFYLHHVLHSLALAKTCVFEPGKVVADIGTGGGFPGIPLSIMFPETSFILIDSIGKKIAAVEEVISILKLDNATALNGRTESMGFKADICTARAVAPMTDLWNWMRGHWIDKPCYYLLKGGDLSQEIADFKKIAPKAQVNETSIASIFDYPFFETKKVVTVG